jgi:two-component system phosphate regulon sensor histidine kinase PhoR
MKDLKELIGYLIISLMLLIFLFISEFNYLKIGILILFLGTTFYFFYSLYKIKHETKEEKLDIKNIFEDILNSIELPIVFYDDKLKILYYNPSFEKFCELKENFIGKTLETWITKNPSYFKLSLIFFPSISGDNLKLLQKEPYEKIEVSGKNKIFLYIVTKKLRFLDSYINMKAVIDRSEIILIEKEEKEFLDLLSHHLKTPLNQIKWLLESVDKEKLDMPEMIDDALLILNKTLILTESIVTLAQLERKGLKLNIQENDIEEILNSCLGLFKKDIEDKELKVNIVIDERVKKIPFDKNVVFLIIYPILQNAVEYNKEGGYINIEVNKIEDKAYAEIKIEDTGIGMEEEEKENLFKKYFRGERAKEIKPTGFGLGMYSVKKLCDIHKIEIKFESEKNVGTRFYLYIPLTKEIYL